MLERRRAGSRPPRARVGRGRGPARPGARSGKSPRGSAPSRTRPRTLLLAALSAALSAAPSDAPPETADASPPERDGGLAASRPRSSGTDPHAASYQARPARGRPARAAGPGRGPCRGRRGRCPAAGRGGTGPPATPGQPAAASPTDPGVLGQRGPPEHDHDALAGRSGRGSQQPARLVQVLAVHEGPSGWASRPWTTLSSPARACATAGASPGRSRNDTAA